MKRATKKKVPAPKPVETVNEAQERIASLHQLMLTEGWRIVCQTLKENADVLRVAIVDKLHPITRVELSDAEADIFRGRVRDLDTLIAIPETLIAHLQTDNEDGDQKLFDPYHTDPRELRK